MINRAKRTVRRVLPPASALGVAAALVLMPVPAHAVAVTGNNTAQIVFNEAGGAPACTVSNPGISSSEAVSSNGATSTRTASGSSTIVDPGELGDTTTATSSSTSVARATEAGGSLKSWDWRATVDASATAAQGAGTDCDASVQAVASLSYSAMTVTTDQWMTLSGDVRGASLVVLALGRTAPVSPAWGHTFIFSSSHSEPNMNFLMPAGTYTLSATIVSQVAAGSANPQTVSGAAHLHADLVPVGTATNNASGSATKYVKFDGTRKCSAGQVKTKFKGAAGDGASAKIKKATFYVNGDKVKTVNLPSKNEKTTLTNVPSADRVTVKVKLQLFKDAGGGKVKASRSYLPCS